MNTDNSHGQVKESKKIYVSPERRIIILRVILCTCLLIAAVVCGYFAYALLFRQESHLMNDQYDSLAQELQRIETSSINAQIQSMKLMTHFFQLQCPNVTNWPNCSVPLRSFDNMTYDLVPMANSRSLTMAPLVTAAEAPGFESFALNFYKEQGFPNLGTLNANVRGIYVRNSNGVPFHNLNVYPSDSKYQILVPIFIIGQLKDNIPAALLNVYFEKLRAASINHVLNCSYASGGSCGGITGVIKLVQDPVFRPAALMNYPIRALNQYDKIVGMMASVINWDTMLTGSLPDYVVGIDVILSTGATQYTFRLSKGTAVYVGIGDLHDTKYSSYARTFTATPFTGAVIYTITTYPSDEFYDQYHTNIPIFACVVVVAILVFTILVFYSYDFFMNRQAMEKELIISTRRQFVNFISHEIRTPLNTISLGMKLLLTEMAQTIQEHQSVGHNPTSEGDSEEKQTIIKKLQDHLSVVKDVEDSSFMAINLLNDILNYDKLMQGKLKIELETFDIWDVVRSASRAFIVQARQKNVTFDMQFQLDSHESFQQFEKNLLVRSRSASVQVKSSSGPEANAFKSKGALTQLFSAPSIDETTSMDPLLSIGVKSAEFKDIEAGDVIGNADHIPSRSTSSNGVGLSFYASAKSFHNNSSKKLCTDSNPSPSRLPTSVDLSPAMTEFLQTKNVIVIGDKIKISQVVRNLVSNALKFTPSNGTVTVSSEWDKNDKRFEHLELEKELKGKDKDLDTNTDTGMEPTTTCPRTESIDTADSRKFPYVERMLNRTNTFRRGSGPTVKANEEKKVCYRSAGSITIKVKDTGAGMTKENLAQLFQEGVQFNANKLQAGGGSGLGLWISKGIVDMHHGLLYATSEGIGLGSTFVLTLPVYKDEVKFRKDIAAASMGQFQLHLDDRDDMDDLNDLDSAFEASVKHRRGSAGSVISTRLSSYHRILTVDDSRLSRRMIARLLVTRGYEVDEAEDGMEALEMMDKSSWCNSAREKCSTTDTGITDFDDFSNSSYDVVLMDSEMPRMNGPTATELMRAKGYKGVIVALTGNVRQEEEDLFMSKGATKVLFKPIEILQLDQALKDIEESLSKTVA